MEKYIPYGRQDISSEDVNEVVQVLKSDFLTQGPAVPKFEKDLIELTGAKFALATNSATSALHIACSAIGIGSEDTVWTSPISFVASSNCALYCGASIDFVDIDPLTNNISIDALKEKLKLAAENDNLPKAIIPVHLAGLSSDMKQIKELSNIYNFKIIEDASHAVGGKYSGKKIGCCQYSDFCVFSFHPVKIIATGEGGALLTNIPELALKAELHRSHGITKDQTDFIKEADGPWYYEQQELGYNYRMTDIQAALGSSQLKRINQFIKKRKKVFNFYLNHLKGLPLILPHQIQEDHSSHHLFIVKLDAQKSKISHGELFRSLRERGVGVNLHYIPIYRHPYYKENFCFNESDFPEAEKYYSTAISLPIFYKLEKSDLEYICNIFQELL